MAENKWVTGVIAPISGAKNLLMDLMVGAHLVAAWCESWWANEPTMLTLQNEPTWLGILITCQLLEESSRDSDTWLGWAPHIISAMKFGHEWKGPHVAQPNPERGVLSTTWPQFLSRLYMPWRVLWLWYQARVFPETSQGKKILKGLDEFNSIQPAISWEDGLPGLGYVVRITPHL